MKSELQNDRSHTCGALNASHVGLSVVLKGWVHRRRDHGGVIFIDLRDRYGITQVVFRPEMSTGAHEDAERIRNEYVVAISGTVEKRPQGMINKKLNTGEIEVVADALEILSEANPIPFSIEEETDASESVRLKYRYLDLRRPSFQQNFILRHRITRAIRQFLDRNDFIDIETPFLTKSTPEGARDYLVPSRLYEGKFYALPQSPQLFKQLLMVAGFDRYYQIVRCFRDEDLRADRQPEFTQMDLEMSFATPEILYRLMEEMFADVFSSVMNLKLSTPFQRMSYSEAIHRFGSDKPDLRWPIEMPNLSTLFSKTEFRVFKGAVSEGGEVRGFSLPGGSVFGRNQLDQLIEKTKGFGAKGLVWVRKNPGELSSSAGKFLSAPELESVATELKMNDGDLALLIADQPSIARSALSALRLHCVEKLNIPPTEKFSFLWIENFPLFGFDEEEKRYVSMHHPFTSPHPADLPLLKEGKEIEKVRARAYDLVLNGYEIGGGSIRIHENEVQKLVFDRLGMSKEEAETKFGFLLEALGFGAPPHGGIALGMDRIAMILAGTDAIRDVIAFPKTQSAVDLMTDAPSEADARQLRELHLSVTKTKK